MHLHEWQRFVNRTCRDIGAVGKGAIVPRIVKVLLDHNPELRTKVLDFGAGKNAVHAKWLKEHGYYVDAYETGSNKVEGVHHAMLEPYYYNLVYASNVLNVQPDLRWLDDTIWSIAYYTRYVAVCNYPKEPRHGEHSVELVEGTLGIRFSVVERIYGPADNPVWLCFR